MNENKKNNYTAPAVKVVAFQVEQGFAGTNVNVGVASAEQATDLHPNVEQGTEAYGFSHF